MKSFWRSMTRRAQRDGARIASRAVRTSGIGSPEPGRLARRPAEPGALERADGRVHAHDQNQEAQDPGEDLGGVVARAGRVDEIADAPVGADELADDRADERGRDREPERSDDEGHGV